MQIRRARASEAAELTALVFAAKRHWGYSDAQMEAWRADLAISGEALSVDSVFVAELDGRAVGFYSLQPGGATCELNHLWVLPAHMSHGFGRALLAHAQLTAAGGGVGVITIDADPNAEPFYAACGARRVAVVAAPIAGQADRVRPQMVLPVAAIGIAINPADR